MTGQHLPALVHEPNTSVLAAAGQSALPRVNINSTFITYLRDIPKYFGCRLHDACIADCSSYIESVSGSTVSGGQRIDVSHVDVAVNHCATAVTANLARQRILHMRDFAIMWFGSIHTCMWGRQTNAGCQRAQRINTSQPRHTGKHCRTSNFSIWRDQVHENDARGRLGQALQAGACTPGTHVADEKPSLTLMRSPDSTSENLSGVLGRLQPSCLALQPSELSWRHLELALYCMRWRCHRLLIHRPSNTLLSAPMQRGMACGCGWLVLKHACSLRRRCCPC